MKQFLLLYFALYCNTVLKGQDTNEYTYTDQKALTIPVAETYSTTSIAGFIKANFKTEKDKLRAIYTWVTTNIRYDPDSMYQINSDKDPETKITAALRRRRGVCENYAAIFNEIAVKSGISSYTVSGYTRQVGSVDRSGHTWCAVYLDSKWLFCDPTWDEGSKGQAKWFLIPPSLFIESHMPFDPLWQLLDHRISHKQFYKGNCYPGKEKLNYNFTDSINASLKLDNLQQLEAASSRIQEEGLVNELVKNRLAYLRMQAGIIYEERNMVLYNAAVAAFNNANIIFNEFIQYRNNRFMPSKPDRKINDMLTPADTLCITAHKKLDEVIISTTNFQYDPGLLKNRLEVLTRKIREQKDFLKRYFATASRLRENLFYK